MADDQAAGGSAHSRFDPGCPSSQVSSLLRSSTVKGFMKRSMPVRVYTCMRGFCVPASTARQLNIGNRDTVFLEIRRRGGQLVFRGAAMLTSGTEVRTGAAVKNLRKGELIDVTIRRP